MAKTIKFNLKLNGNSIRNIQDLKENFVLEEILKYYKEGLFLRWLEVRNYDEYAEQVKNINSEENYEILKQLINIFDIEQDTKEIEKILYFLKFEEEEKVLLEKYKKNNFKKQQIIDDYISGYAQIFDEIRENKDNLQKLKAIVTNIEKNYKDLFAMDKFMYNRIKDEGLKIIFAILMNENLRDIIVKNKRLMGDFKGKYENIIEKAKYFGDDLKEFRGTVEYWKDLIEDGKKILVTYATNIVIREPKNRNSEKQISNEYLYEIFNGLDIQSVSGQESYISYLEV